MDKKEDNTTLLYSEKPIDNFSIYQHIEANESFLEKPSLVQEVIECLEGIENANKMESSKKRRKSSAVRKSVLGGFDFLVTLRKTPSARASFKRIKTKKLAPNTNQFTFMRQIDVGEEDRTLARQEREMVAETFRRSGNYEYRKLRFDVAIDYYTRGLTYVKDTPVLYVNRAMCYIKLREYKRGIMDCDYVLAHIDGRHLRAWLYRAAAFKRLNDESNFEYSVYQARLLNHTEQEFIDNFLEKMQSLL